MTKLTIAALVLIISFMAACRAWEPAKEEQVQAQAPRLVKEEQETPWTLTCRTATTVNGEIEQCTYGPVEKVQDCPDGQIRVCVRRYGDRTCDCYPE